MKRLLISLSCILICLSAVARNRALLIGIGEYPESSGWEKISAANDMKLLSSTLKGYDITILQDEKATYAGIKNAFAQFTAKCTAGDTVIVHFSCHGQQMYPAKKGDIEEPDSLDEALIPYDARAKYSNRYKGECHLRDNELSLMVDSIRKRVGYTGFVLITLDACHSDASNRNSDSMTYRGFSYPFGRDVDKEKHLKYKYNTSKTPILQKDDMAEVLYVSACKSYERNLEIQFNNIGYGSLTMALSRHFASFRAHHIDIFIKELKEEMNRLVRSRQHPGFRSSLNINQ